MNKTNYDMPLQGILKRKFPTQNSVFSIQELISPVHTQQQGTGVISCNFKYDLPRQRLNDEYLEKKYQQNRPCAFKNLYNDFSKFTATKSYQNEVEKNKNNQNQINNSNIKTKVSSIYQKLLLQNNTKKKQVICPILTEATFKPKQLSKQIIKNRHHQSASTLTNKKIDNNKLISSNSSKNISKSKKSFDHVKKLDFVTSTKTKYQKILQQHFQNSNFHSKKNQFITPDDIRLSKICGKNSVILKLKQRLQPNFSTTKQLIEQNKNAQSQKSTRTTCKSVNKNKNKNLRQQIDSHKQLKSYKQQLKQSQSEKWMQMNFYQRQERVISNRKEKQVIGKQKQIQKQIQPCTFKPELLGKCRSEKIQQPIRHSYLQQYYQKLNRKY